VVTSPFSPSQPMRKLKAKRGIKCFILITNYQPDPFRTIIIPTGFITLRRHHGLAFHAC
jgi:hypothetical protein